MGFRTFDRHQTNLLGYSLDDFVESNAKCRFIVQLVSLLDLNELYERYSNIGADAFDPSAMLATWFFSYSESITSTRYIEQQCKRDTHFMYTSCNFRPDHTTLSRFRKDNLDLISQYFVEIIRLAKEKGLSDFKHITIDGTKIQASASPRKSKDSEALARYLAAVRKDIQDYMSHCDEEDLYEDDQNDENLPIIQQKLKKLKDLESTLIERKKQLEERKQNIKKEHRDTHEINITEPDAYNMRYANGKQTAPGYNAQASVDTETQLIVAADVIQDRADFDQFTPQHQAVERSLGKDSKRKYTGDSGYHKLEQLDYIARNNIDAVVNDPDPQSRSIKRKKPSVKELLQSGRQLTRSDFIFKAQENCYECPANQKLCYSHKYKTKKFYKADNCQNCPIKTQCLSVQNTTGIRTIQRDEREILAELMAIKLKTEQAKERLGIRKTTVEPVFGNLKQNLGFRRFSLRGIENIKGEFKLMAIAHNINKLYKMTITMLLSIDKLLSNAFVFIRLKCFLNNLLSATPCQGREI